MINGRVLRSEAKRRPDSARLQTDKVFFDITNAI